MGAQGRYGFVHHLYVRYVRCGYDDKAASFAPPSPGVTAAKCQRNHKDQQQENDQTFEPANSHMFVLLWTSTEAGATTGLPV